MVGYESLTVIVLVFLMYIYVYFFLQTHSASYATGITFYMLRIFVEIILLFGFGKVIAVVTVREATLLAVLVTCMQVDCVIRSCWWLSTQAHLLPKLKYCQSCFLFQPYSADCEVPNVKGNNILTYIYCHMYKVCNVSLEVYTNTYISYNIRYTTTSFVLGECPTQTWREHGKMWQNLV